MCPIPYSIQPHISGLCVYGYCLPCQSGRCNETKRKVENYTVFRLLICSRFAPIATFYFQFVIRQSFCKIRNSDISYHYYQFLCDCVRVSRLLFPVSTLSCLVPRLQYCWRKSISWLLMPYRLHCQVIRIHSLDNVDKWVLVFHEEPFNCPCHPREDKSWKTQIY